ncbi:helicase C-terminal domain-containing protein [Clostridium butyricum]|uniref:helicase C-terminal domain-containing protein n=1 Tax=Clostridium butyricum TaxID=1492 RepID=UPI00071B9E80|nr:helicase C-terminal domain-containing protein [Clostridium butyricum]ALP88703.1 ATP-dependent helicase [Clostridium butyricum]ALS18306.1 ATP-dependent helicase [Clostridium butyricum]ANF15431.1 ATP-dependent helicase [Clostridium butyricum]AOR95380.1 ATP-dependent helicase [Clostridium butyricum]MCI3009664.1 DEAD/DEAH box helicase [Clostridium butyricum]
MEKIIIRESVRNLVEFCLLKGDIDNRFSGNARALEGTRAHQKLQKDNAGIYSEYEKEVFLTREFELKNSIIKVEGRADGIIFDDGKIIIEEIKSTYKSFVHIDDSNEVHWAQAKLYALIYCLENNLSKIFIRLSYVQLETDEVKSFEYAFNIEELRHFAFEILEEYEKFNVFIYNEKKERNESIKNVVFPFDSYREGQRKLINVVYSTIKEKEKLFAQAPTGIGKTISTIFPAVKALGEGIGDKIIYLTPKTINREVAKHTFDKLRNTGLKFRSIVLTAKEKSCINDQFDCNPEKCVYAKEYYNKVKNVVLMVLEENECISVEILQDYAQKYKVCPFELSLDISMYCDGIICDYNYMFDPRVSLTRMIEQKDNIVLIDESHNLIDRSKKMYSASLNKDQILKCKKIAKGKLRKLHSVLDKLNSYFIELRNECTHKNVTWFYENDGPKDLSKYLNLYLKESEEILVKGNKFEGYDEILQLYFDINSFNTIMQLYDENYVTCVEKDSQEVVLTLYCVNPSENLKKCLKKNYSTVFFSATLSPIKYYIEMLGGENESYRLKLPSPFKKENLNVYVSPVNIRYKYRMRTLPNVIDKICSFVNKEIGNYIVFAPSYAYMESLWEDILKCDGLDMFKLIKQESNMDEKEKSDFLKQFKENNNLLVFCVLGGMFSEGIDLPGEQLIGSVIIGVGYPKIAMENEISREFFGENGYDYAYVYPGINKVQQAAGRVIRTENDEGRVLLIDDRYITSQYNILLPSEWYPIKKF